jgi:hypothetical protein
MLSVYLLPRHPAVVSKQDQPHNFATAIKTIQFNEGAVYAGSAEKGIKICP